MKTKFLWMTLGLLGLSLVSCTKTDSEDSAYVSVQQEGSKMWSLLDVGSGKIVMSDEFFAPASSVVKGSFFVENDNNEFDLYNLKDTKNKLNRSSYSIVTNFSPDGYAIVRVKEEPWQIIDTEGNTVSTLDKTFSVLAGFSKDNLAMIANKDGMIGYVDPQGQTPIKPRYKFGTIFSDGVALVLTKQEDNHNYFSAIDPTGNTLFTFSDAKYSNIGLFKEGHMFAVEGDHCVLLDKTGKKIMTVCNGTNISNLAYQKGKIIYYDGEFYGLKDTEDKILIRAKYQRLKFQSDGNLIAVNSNGKWGVINDQDDIVTPFDYDVLEYLAPGRYITRSGSVAVLIDGKGKEICDKAFDNFLNRSNTASENELTSLISASNNNVKDSFSNVDELTEFLLNLSNIDELSAIYETSDGALSPGEYNGLVDDKYPIVMEITSCEGDKVFGNTFYPSSVAKYGKTSQTLMPFSGEYSNGNLKLIVKSPTDVTYGEDWDLYIGEGILDGTITTNTGKVMSVTLEM